MDNDKQEKSTDNPPVRKEADPGGGADEAGLFGEAAKKSDEELARLTPENQGNFLFLMKRYEEKLTKYILRISSVRREDAEDILQDVFIKVFQNLNDFNPELKFSSWIYRITHNQVISNHRKKQARPESESIGIDEEIINKLASDLNIEKEVDRRILRQSIYKILNKLDIKYREVLILKFLEEKDYKEISDILKKPMGTVATLLSRAKDGFRKELKKQSIRLH